VLSDWFVIRPAGRLWDLFVLCLVFEVFVHREKPLSELSSNKLACASLHYFTHMYSVIKYFLSVQFGKTCHGDYTK
jgi:hypothetical protein